MISHLMKDIVKMGNGNQKWIGQEMSRKGSKVNCWKNNYKKNNFVN